MPDDEPSYDRGPAPDDSFSPAAWSSMAALVDLENSDITGQAMRDPPPPMSRLLKEAPRVDTHMQRTQSNTHAPALFHERYRKDSPLEPPRDSALNS